MTSSQQEALAALREGLAAHQGGRLAEAEAAYRRALAIQPGQADCLGMIGVLYHQTGRGDLAVEHLRKAAGLQPKSAEIVNNLGGVLRDLGRPAEAAAVFRRAARLQPNQPEIHRNLGCALADSGEFYEAAASFRAALRLNPLYTDAANDLGNALVALGRNQEAVECLAGALRTAPADPKLHNTMGLALQALGRTDEALGRFREAARLRPDYAKAWTNLGAALLGRRANGEAVSVLREGLRRCPDSADLTWNLANAALTLGDFETGWAAYEARWRMQEMAAHWPDTGIPIWDGAESLAGKTVLLFAEQGHGDTIQFVRLAPLIAARGAKVVLLAQPALVSLLARLPGVEACLGFGDALPQADLQYPLMSLPFALGLTLDGLPASCPYLVADADAAAAWRGRLAGLPGLKVGLVWAGDPRPDQAEANRVDRRRSLKLDQLAPLADIAGVSFVSLQKGKPAEQARAGLPGVTLHDWTDELRSFDDTAALTQNLDLVVSADTAVAHLAGALGRPVWLLNRFDSCWRWLDGRDDSPWYPSLRQFRQTAPGDWAGVIARMRSALAELAGGPA
jgi:Flp pilus assembly protein TadD